MSTALNCWSATEMPDILHRNLFIARRFLRAGWPLTWKTWKSQGIPKWSEKSQGNWNLLRRAINIPVTLLAFGSLWAWTLDMFIIDTLVAFSKLVTMLVIINVKQDCSSAMQYIDNLYLSRLLEKSGNIMWSGKWPSCRRIWGSSG